MKVSWRILALAGGVVLGASVGAACTVTSGSGDDDAGLFGDSGTGGGDSGTNNDSGTNPDTGSGSCSNGRDEITDAGTVELTFDLDGGSACDDCLDQNCCDSLSACFHDPSGNCQGLEDCLQSCVGLDDDGGCSQTCGDAYGNDAITAHQNWTQCGSDHCTSVCPFQ